MKRLSIRGLLAVFLAALTLQAAFVPDLAHAQATTAGRLPVLSGSRDAYPDATLALDFIGSKTNGISFYKANGVVTRNFAALPGLTVSRASVGYAEKLDGSLVLFQPDVARITDKGLLVEESRTNSIRNSTANNGAVAGTPGTLPTFWGLTLPSGLSSQVVATGTDPATGLPCIDLRIFGTTTGAGAFYIYFETGAGIAASNGQTWAGSAYIALVGGTLNNVGTLSLTQIENTSSGAYVRETVGTGWTPGATASRQSTVATLSGGGTVAAIVPAIRSSSGLANGVAVDLTLRIAAPQDELGALPTSYIPTVASSATRGADSVSIGGLSVAQPFGFVSRAIVANLIASTSPSVAQLDDGTSNNFVVIYRNAAGAFHYKMVASTATVFDATLGTGSSTTTAYGAAIRSQGGSYSGSLAGAAAVSASASATTLPTLTEVSIGSQGGGNPLNGYVQELLLYPRALSDAEIQAASQ